MRGTWASQDAVVERSRYGDLLFARAQEGCSSERNRWLIFGRCFPAGPRTQIVPAGRRCGEARAARCGRGRQPARAAGALRSRWKTCSSAVMPSAAGNRPTPARARRSSRWRVDARERRGGSPAPAVLLHGDTVRAGKNRRPRPQAQHATRTGRRPRAPGRCWIELIC